VPILAVTVVANFFNAFFNWTLIFGRMGLPELGLVGAGIATSLTRVLMCLALLLAIRARRLHAGAWGGWSRRAFERAGLVEILALGVPVAIQLTLEVSAFGVSTLMAGALGTTDAAAHLIVLNMASISFMVPMGISFAAVTRVGNLIGRGDHEDAQRAAWVAFAMGGLVMGGFALSFYLGRSFLPGLYGPEQEVLALAASVLPIAAAFQVFDGLQVVGGGVLRGMGKTLPAAWFNLFGYYVLALPIGWWMAFRTGLGLAGLWYGLLLALATVALLLVAWVRVRGPRHLARA
jgi:MATE family multidrug resistance protein